MSENEPQYWRMQLHPNDSENSMFYTVQCLAHGYIGLDFGEAMGDLKTEDISQLPPSEKLFVQIESPMKSGDIVLVMSHNKPVALVKVIGEYVFINEYLKDHLKFPAWCSHFRPVQVLSYYADWAGEPELAKKLIMSNTIQPIDKQDGLFYQLVDKWHKWIKEQQQ